MISTCFFPRLAEKLPLIYYVGVVLSGVIQGCWRALGPAPGSQRCLAASMAFGN